MKRSRRPWVAPRDGCYRATEPTTGPASPSGVGSANTPASGTQFAGEQHPEPQHITARSMLRSIECLSAALAASGVAVDSVVQSAQRGAEEGLRRRLGGHER